MALAVGALCAVAVAAPRDAAAVPTSAAFDGLGGSGFDNCATGAPGLCGSLWFDPAFAIPTADDWGTAGAFGLPGSTGPSGFDLFIEQTAIESCMGPVGTETCTPAGGGQGPFHVNVTWTIRRNASRILDMDGPVLLFFSGLQSSPAYDGALVGIDLASGWAVDPMGVETPVDFEVVQYSVGIVDYYYVGLLLDGSELMEGDVVRRFSLDVDQAADPMGTPGLAVNAFFVPEPTTGILVIAGLSVIALRRRR